MRLTRVLNICVTHCLEILLRTVCPRQEFRSFEENVISLLSTVMCSFTFDAWAAHSSFNPSYMAIYRSSLRVAACGLLD
jgi:hypothetical protein